MNANAPLRHAGGSSNGSQSFALEFGARSEPSIHVMALEGRETMSEPYAFDVWFTSPDVLDAADVVGQPASVALDTGAGTLGVAGVALQFDRDDPTPAGDYTYHLVIGPQLALSDLCRQNQIFGTQDPVSVTDLIAGKLDATLGRGSTAGAMPAPVAYELRIMADYPQRDHVAQFDESDLAFLSRTCEHHGIFYFFEQRSGNETVVFGDSNHAFRQAAGGESLPFRRTRGQADDVSISSVRETSRPVPRTVFVRDYDDTQALTELLASHVVDDGGHGAVVEYGPNFRSLEEGTRVAQVRAEERAARKTLYRGVSTAPGLRPGTFFRMTDHPNPALNMRYLVVAVSHSAGDTLTRNGPYENSFEAIPFATPFRPRRKTPRPSVGGLFNATIDSAGDGSSADLDPSGRYKLRHIYDETNSPAGQASAFVRQAQPYTGAADTGLQLPLRKNTGILVGYLNGDPDRPVIVGAVPGSTTPSVVSRTNATVNRLRTPAGGLLEINDGSVEPQAGVPDPYVRLAAQNRAKTEFPEANYLRLGSYVTDEAAILPTAAASPAAGSTISVVPVVTTSSKTATTHASAKDYADAQNTAAPTAAEQTVSVTTSAPIACPGPGVLVHSNQDLMVSVGGSAFLKYGGGHGTAVVGGDVELDVAKGQYTLNALNGVTITAGLDGSPADLVLTAYNYINQTSKGPTDTITYGDSTTITHGNSYAEVHGNTKSIFYGDATSIFLGTSKSWALDADVTAKVAGSLLLFAGITTSIILGASISIVAGNMSYLYLLTYAELYWSFFISLKFGVELVVKDFTSEYKGTWVHASGTEASTLGAKIQSAVVEVKDAVTAVTETTVSVVQEEVSSTLSALSANMAEVVFWL